LDKEKIVAALKWEREKLIRAIAALEDSKSHPASKTVSAATVLPSVPKGEKHGNLTQEGRRRLSLAMKKRWAERRKGS
jgi:hypothetical protein